MIVLSLSLHVCEMGMSTIVPPPSCTVTERMQRAHGSRGLAWRAPTGGSLSFAQAISLPW